MTTAARAAILRDRIARRALATINTPDGAVIMAVVRTGTVVTIATHTPDAYFPYCVDSYRLLTTVERADEADWGYPPRTWTLTEQCGAYGPDEIPGLIADAVAYARHVTLAV